MRGFRAVAIAAVLVAVMLAGCSDSAPAKVPAGAPGKSVHPGDAPPSTPGSEALVTAGTLSPATDSIVVQWSIPDADVNTLSYVEYGEAGKLDRKSLRMTGPGAQQTLLAGLDPGTAYNYRIVIVKGESVVRSPIQAFSTSGAPTVQPVEDPANPGGLQVLAANVPQVQTDAAVVTWTIAGGDGTVGSYVEYGTDEGYGMKTDATFGRGTFASRLPNLSPGQQYYFRIAARDAATIVQSDAQSFLTPLLPGVILGSAPPLAGPAAPSGVEDLAPPQITTVTNTAPTGKAVGFYWTVTDEVDPDVTSWVEYGIASLTEKSEAQAGIGDLFGYVTGLDEATTYMYRVFAVDRAGNLAESGTYTFTTPVRTPSGCAAPAVVSVAVPPSGISTAAARISWNVSTPCSFVALRSRAEFRVVGETTFRASNFFTGAGAQSTTMANLVPDTQYEVRIFVEDSLYQGTYSSPMLTFVTLPPPQIVSVLVKPDLVLEDRFTVEWIAMGPADAETWVEAGESSYFAKAYPSRRLDTPAPPNEFMCACTTTVTDLQAESEYEFVVYVAGSRGLASSAPPVSKQWTAKLIPIEMKNLDQTLPNGTVVSTRVLSPQPLFTYFFNRPHTFHITNNFDVAARWQLWSDEDCDATTPPFNQFGSLMVETDVLTANPGPDFEPDVDDPQDGVDYAGNTGYVPRATAAGLAGARTSITLPQGEYCMRALDINDNLLAIGQVTV